MADDEVGSRRTRGPYAKSAAVRARILDACLEVFGESGYGASTMKEVALRSGLSQRGLLHHFGSKRELLMAVIRAHEDAAHDLPNEGRSDVVSAVITLAMETAQRRGIVELHTTLSAEATSTEHPAHAHYTARYDRLRDYLGGSFEALRQEGRLRSPERPDVLASMLIALLDGLQLQWLYSPDRVDFPGSIRAFLDAIGADASSA